MSSPTTIEFLGLQVSIAVRTTASNPTAPGICMAQHRQHLDKVTIAASHDRG